MESKDREAIENYRRANLTEQQRQAEDAFKALPPHLQQRMKKFTRIGLAVVFALVAVFAIFMGVKINQFGEGVEKAIYEGDRQMQRWEDHVRREEEMAKTREWLRHNR